MDFSIEYSDPEMQFRQKLFGVLASAMKVDIKIVTNPDCYFIYFTHSSFLIFSKEYFRHLYDIYHKYDLQYVSELFISNVKHLIVDFYFKERYKWQV